MAGYFTVTLVNTPGAPVPAAASKASASPKAPVTGSDQVMLTVASVNQYKGNVRIDFTLSGVTGGSVTPPYTYAFLDEDEELSQMITVNGTSSGTLTAVGYDGEDTDTDSCNVTPA